MSYIDNSRQSISPLDRCRNAFFSALVLNQQGFPTYVLPSWHKGIWSIFLGPENLARSLLLQEPNAIAVAASWTLTPSETKDESGASSPSQIANKILEQAKDVVEIGSVSKSYKQWLEDFSLIVGKEAGLLPTIKFSDNQFEVWLHFRNPDLSSNGQPIERYLTSPPLPRLFLENRRQRANDIANGKNEWWKYSTYYSNSAKKAGNSDEQSDPIWWRNRNET